MHALLSLLSPSLLSPFLLSPFLHFNPFSSSAPFFSSHPWCKCTPFPSPQVAMRALLSAGSKSPSHLSVALERYSSLLGRLLDACGGRSAQHVSSRGGGGEMRGGKEEEGEGERRRRAVLCSDHLRLLDACGGRSAQLVSSNEATRKGGEKERGGEERCAFSTAGCWLNVGSALHST